MIVDLTPVVAFCTSASLVNAVVVVALLVRLVGKEGRYRRIRTWLSSPQRIRPESVLAVVDESKENTGGLFSPGTPGRPRAHTRATVQKQLLAADITLSPSTFKSRASRKLLDEF
eukprot:m.19137 g.19137  ORF g.19137 m.19137 type:complete len:115 (-) comp30693_c0_seq2:54-398(-)